MTRRIIRVEHTAGVRDGEGRCISPRAPHGSVTPTEWAAVVEHHLLDALAARERATDDRVAAVQAEAEAIREVRYWEVIALELAFEVGSRP